jgi:hypothetical protein
MRRGKITTAVQQKREAEAGFAISTYDQGLIEDNLHDRILEDPDFRKRAAHAGLIDSKGALTFAGADLLSNDAYKLERNAVAWLTYKFRHIRVDGHDNHGDLIGSVWFDPTNQEHAYLIEIASGSPGRSERIDMADASYGDLAHTAFDGVHDFGASILGGAITFFDVKPEDWETIERTLERRTSAKRRRR